MTLTYDQAVQAFKACKEAGATITTIKDTDDYAIYKVSAKTESAEFHFNRKDGYAMIFR